MSTATERRRRRAIIWWIVLGGTASLAGTIINLATRSGWPRVLSLMLVIFGMTAACAGPVKHLMAPFLELTQLLLGEQLPQKAEPLVDRLNRAAAEYQHLLDAIGKVLILLLVALIALAGVILTIVVVRN